MMTLSGSENTMNYPYWFLYKGARAIGHTLQYMDSWGEFFANEFGLTAPLYQDLIDQHKELVS